MTRKIFIISTILLALSINFYAQSVSDGFPKNLKTEKITEFGQVGECYLSAELDNLFIRLQQNPESKGVIISYQGADILPGRFGVSQSRMYENHIRLRRYDRSRIEIIEGGFRTEQMTEIWLVPPGGKMPKPSNTVPKPTLPKNKSFLYDKKYLGYEVYGYWTSDDYMSEFLLPAEKARREAEQAAFDEELRQSGNLIEADEEQIETETATKEEIENDKFSWTNERFGEILKTQKNSSGVIIFYADDQIYDINALQTFIGQGRDRIAKSAGILPGRIQILFGGFRYQTEAEFWIMPRNGEFPKIAPEEREIEEQDEINAENL